MKHKVIIRIILSGFIVGGIFGFFQYIYGFPVTAQKIAHIQATCGIASNTQSTICYRREFKKVIKLFNLKEIAQAMEDNDRQQNSKLTNAERLNCHGVAHIVGEMAGQLPYASAPDLIASCGSRCGYGCTHGVVMGVLKKNRDLISSLGKFCQRPDGGTLTPTDTIACFHGLGHGLAEYTGYRIPEAITYCETLGRRESREECMTGVFMEVYSPADSNHDPIPLPQVLFSPCTNLIGLSLDFCKRMMITSSYRVDKQITPAYKLCLSEFGFDMQTCVFTIGADVYFQEQENVDKIIHACSMIGEHKDVCIHGAVMSSISIHLNAIQASEICKKADSEAVCITYTNNRLHEMNLEVR